MWINEQFIYHLRDALNHLYNPHHLRHNPLVSLLGVADRPDASSALRRILMEAIESLRPDAEVLPQSRAWRIYDLLLYRYVQQFSQQEVADQLGLSVRHLRREQQAALEALACRLWEQYRLAEEQAEEAVPTEASSAESAVNEELTWLKEAQPEKPTPLGPTLSAVLDLARPLATRHQVHLESAPADALPDLPVHAVVLRQLLLSLLSVAIHRTPGGRVRISVRPERQEVEIQVSCTNAQSDPAPPLNDDAVSLDIARQLVGLCGGQLTLAEEKAFTAALTLPALGQFPVLVIDDNADTLQLLQRYTSGTRYRLISTRDPEQALPLVKEFSPQIIVLDVMMPQVDGWEVLERLRQHPLTRHIPIIVCTILAQEELALSLGASAFVRKPVTRQAFLAALDRQIAWMGTEPH